jgi:hypothetical protein
MEAEPLMTSTRSSLKVSRSYSGASLQAVAVDVASLAQREAAQAHVFLAGLAGQEGDAGGGAQHLAEVVLVAVLDQLFGHHGDALRDVAQLLVALADLGAGGAQLSLAGGGAVGGGGVTHGDGAQRAGHGGTGRGGLGQRGGAQRAGQQHGAQRQQGSALCFKSRSF